VKISLLCIFVSIAKIISGKFGYWVYYYLETRIDTICGGFINSKNLPGQKKI
jgi:hypothetical protein